MRDGLGLGGRVAQLLPGPAMQRLPADLEQAVVGRIPDQRVLEAVVRPRRRVLDEQDVGLGEPLQGGLEAGVGDLRYAAQPCVREIVSENSADLGHLPRRPKPVEAGGEGLLQCRRDRVRPDVNAALQNEARDLLHEQGYAAGALAHRSHHVVR